MKDIDDDVISPSAKGGTVSSHMSSSHQSSRRHRRRRRIGDGLSSGQDTMSRASGFQSLAKGGTKRSIRGRGKKSISMAMANETLINKIQENFNEFKKSTEAQL